MPAPIPVEVVLLPGELDSAAVTKHAAVVFDVLRATTTIAAALSEGVRRIEVFASTGAAAEAARQRRGAVLLCGEEACLPPPGFDLGNSPRAFQRALHHDREMLFSTTNGTRAILAAAGAKRLFAGAIVNARAVAALVAETGLAVDLICAGTAGNVAMEDVLGAGAVIDALQQLTEIKPVSDKTIIAARLFVQTRHELVAALRSTRGGMNVIDAGLEADIDFAAALNSVDVAGLIEGTPPVITPIRR